jgi:hypothetical protein
MHITLHKATMALRPVLGFLLACAFLNVLLNLSYPAQEPHILSVFRLSPEIVFILFLLCIAIGLKMPFHLAVYLPLTALVIFLRLFRVGDFLVPMYFNRPLNVYLDSQFLDDLVFLLYSTLPTGIFIVYCGLTVFLLILISWGVWHAFKTIHAYFAKRRSQRFFMLSTAMLLFSLLLLYNGAIPHPMNLFAQGLLPRITEEFNFILHVQGYRDQQLGAIQQSLKKAEHIPSSLDKLGGANVYIFFIESYGHTIFSNPRHFALIAPLLEATERELNAQGFAVVSNFLRSPTFGGASWQAHGTLASGIPLNTQMQYNLLLSSKVPTIAEYFNKAGYYTVSVMPGTLWPWPQGDFFKYQKKYYAWHFDYQGPQHGWSPMPDQFVLDHIYHREIQRQAQPLFIKFALVSSHAPFDRQPPYLEDWSKIGDGGIYHKSEVITFPVVWPDLSNASGAFMTAMSYDIKVLRGFMTRYVNSQELIIILGDHQPNVQISGENQPWSVPIHVISRNTDFLEPFIERGYSEGLIPDQPPPYFGMDTFLWDFLDAFSRSSEQRTP